MAEWTFTELETPSDSRRRGCGVRCFSANAASEVNASGPMETAETGKQQHLVAGMVKNGAATGVLTIRSGNTIVCIIRLAVVEERRLPRLYSTDNEALRFSWTGTGNVVMWLEIAETTSGQAVGGRNWG